MTMKLEVVLKPNAILPKKATEGSVGWDLHAYGPDRLRIASRLWRLIPTGVAVRVPVGYEGVVRPRSGLTKRGIVAAIGTIDQDYTGELFVNLFNFSDSEYWVAPGDRIAQLVISPILQLSQEDVILVDTLPETQRGSNGFGSTGT